MDQMTIFDMMFDEYKIDKPIRLIELFAGAGAQSKALENLGANFEHYHICEWAVPSILVYNEIHHKYLPKYGTDFCQNLTKEEVVEYLYKRGISLDYNNPAKIEQIKRMPEEKLRKIYNAIISTNNLVNVQETKGKDLEIVDTDKYIYLCTYSFPCQDLSVAGKGAGMSRGAGTRSGMLWEVERMLKECQEIGELPQVLLMENVPQVIGEGNINDFREWQEQLESMGYSNYVKVLNARDYGIPQSRERCFMLSILGEYNYRFPKPIKLEKTSKDIFGKNAEEKYYLSEKQIRDILGWEAYQDPFDSLGREVCPTLTTRSGAYAAGMILTTDGTIEEEIELKKQLKNDGYVVKRYKEFIDKNGYIPEIFQPFNAYEVGDVIPTMTTSCGSATGKSSILIAEGGMFTDLQASMLDKDGNVKRYIDSDVVDEFKEGQVADISFPNGYNKGPRVHDECPAINTTTTSSSFIYKESQNPLRIRKMTPYNAFEFMGFTKEDCDNAKKVVSDAWIFHIAGDSIVVQVLEAIFKQML